jgi:AcrR family transcriptional regulator
MRISPGNLYYHYPAKDELINALFDRYERALNESAAGRRGCARTSRTRGCSCTCCSS